MEMMLFYSCLKFMSEYQFRAFSIFGLSALLLQSAELFFLIKVLSAAYLFYIGIKSILSSFSHIPSVSREEVKDVSVRGRSSYFVESFLTQILNPKVSMFYLAAFPQFISPEAFAYMDAFVLVSIYAGIIFIWFTGVIYVLRRMRYVANSSTVGQWIQRLSGTAMVYFSSLVLSQK